MTNLEHDQLLPTAPEVGFEVAMALACSWIFALHIFVSVCTLSFDIVATSFVPRPFPAPVLIACSTSLVPRPFPAPVLIACSIKTEGKAWEKESRA